MVLQKQLENHLGSGDAGNWRSATERVEEFCRWSEDLLIRIEHNELVGGSFIIRIRRFLILLALFYALILNILVLAFANTSQGFNSEMFLVLRLMGIFELLLVIVIFAGFIQENARPFHYIQWKNRYWHVYQKLIRNGSCPKHLGHPSILFRFPERTQYIQSILPFLAPRAMPPRLKYGLFSIWHFLLDIRIDGTMYHLVIIAVVLLGIALHPFCYSFLLLDVMRQSGALRTVLRAIFDIKAILIAVGILMATLIWIYSLYVFVVFPELLSNPGSNLYCDYPLQCFLSLLYLGVSNVGVIMQFINGDPWQDIVAFIFGTMMLNMVFYITIGMILFNIIFAVIVDQFGKIRDLKTEILNEFLNRCFICSIERENFQRVASDRNISGFDFQSHVLTLFLRVFRDTRRRKAGLPGSHFLRPSPLGLHFLL